jgi:hypothetical protein
MIRHDLPEISAHDAEMIYVAENFEPWASNFANNRGRGVHIIFAAFVKLLQILAGECQSVPPLASKTLFLLPKRD